MKALVVNALGRGFDVEDVDIAAPIGREVLVDVKASGLCHTDLLFATHHFVPMPAVLGHEVAGVVAEVGPNVAQIRVGDHVVGSLRMQDCTRSYGIEEGAEVLVGGEGHPRGLEAGNFVKPTVFVNVKNDMTIAQEEIFGPVLCVITYETEEDAIRIANDTSFGLHAFVSGTDIQRARRVASQILAGRVAINGMLDDQQAPFGGFKNSGVGREFGTFGIEAFLEPRAILE
jgi:delta 1-pyrroline-5-carboxylate dehydrogenase